jgi:hypothetical protein
MDSSSSLIFLIIGEIEGNFAGETYSFIIVCFSFDEFFFYLTGVRSKTFVNPY